jgi:hypothetical protein
MGHQFSTPEQEVTRSVGKGFVSSRPRHLANQDDGLSRTTDIMDEPSSGPPSPVAVNYAPRAGLRYSQSWRRGIDRADTVPQSEQRTPLDERQFQSPLGHYPFQEHSHAASMESPAPLRQRRTIPVKRPQRKSQSVTGVPSCHDGSADEHDSSYLERLYDSRTWAMYWRITEARRKTRQEHYSVASNSGAANWEATQPGLNLHHHPYPTDSSGPPSEDTLEWENLQHDYVDSFLDDSGGQHEMIFLFDL